MEKDTVESQRVIYTPEQTAQYKAVDKAVGRRLRARRVEKGLTMEIAALRITDLGMPCGLNKLRRIEQGMSCRYWNFMLITLCQLYNLEPNTLFGANVQRVKTS